MLSNEKQQWQEKENNYEKQVKQQQTDLEVLNKSVLNIKEQFELSQFTIQGFFFLDSLRKILNDFFINFHSFAIREN